MTTPAQEAPFVLPAVAFRPVRLGIICLVLAGLAAGLSAYLEHPMFGLFFAVGLAMAVVVVVPVAAVVATGSRCPGPHPASIATATSAPPSTTALRRLGLDTVPQLPTPER